MNDEAAPQGRLDHSSGSIPAASAWSKQTQDAFYTEVDALMARARQRAEVRAAGRLWRAMMLALDVDTCESILRRLPVRAGNLDGFVLRRALRGGRLPNAEDYIEVTTKMLAAVGEAGPIPEKKGRR